MSHQCKLAFFVTSTHCYAAIKTTDSYVQGIHILDGQSQSSVLIPLIKQLWDSVGNPTLTTLIVPKGPGSFTSLRVSLAVAQGLSVAFPDAQCFSPIFFDVLLQDLPENSYAVIDSKRGDYFVKTKTGSPLILLPEELLNFQKAHVDWQMVLEPDLINTDFISTTNVSAVYYQPEHLLAVLLSAETYTPLENSLSVFEPYYLFEPLFKKS